MQHFIRQRKDATERKRKGRKAGKTIKIKRRDGNEIEFFLLEGPQRKPPGKKYALTRKIKLLVSRLPV